MKKRIITITLTVIAIIGTFTGCASLERGIKDINSDLSGGLDRTIVIYTATGEEIARYEGKIDIAPEGDSFVEFELNGKRYVYYNCFVEVIEK